MHNDLQLGLLRQASDDYDHDVSPDEKDDSVRCLKFVLQLVRTEKLKVAPAHDRISIFHSLHEVLYRKKEIYWWGDQTNQEDDGSVLAHWIDHRLLVDLKVHNCSHAHDADLHTLFQEVAHHGRFVVVVRSEKFTHSWIQAFICTSTLVNSIDSYLLLRNTTLDEKTYAI